MGLSMRDLSCGEEMRGMGAAAALIVTAVALTACGGEGRGSTAEAEGGGRAARTADQNTVTPAAVRDDIRAAVTAGDFPRPRFIVAEELLGPCEVSAVVRATTKPDSKATAKVLAELKHRGWRERRQLSSSAGNTWGLEKKDTILTFVAGTVSEKAVAFGPAAERQGRAEPFQGLLFREVGACGAHAATASP
ncbi:hypothetical protein [Streptomyces sp. NPDC056291]|uniref:hypothetical protein n=1 Tax=Streptomyces sp. NPDC056291 TaxID=3345772 RepID=UPI0035D983C0